MTLLETIDNDNSTFLADFGVTVTYKPDVGESSDITAIFEKAGEVVYSQTGETLSYPPFVIVREEDIPDADYSDDVWVDDGTIGGTTYHVRGIEKDDTGMVKLILSED